LAINRVVFDLSVVGATYFSVVGTYLQI